jgi:hypothetical protein
LILKDNFAMYSNPGWQFLLGLKIHNSISSCSKICCYSDGIAFKVVWHISLSNILSLFCTFDSLYFVEKIFFGSDYMDVDVFPKIWQNSAILLNKFCMLLVCIYVPSILTIHFLIF